MAIESFIAPNSHHGLMPGVYLLHYGAKKDFQFQENLAEDYQVLKKLGFKPGMSKFYQNILGNKGDGLGPFNLAVYCPRKYRKPGPKEPWYILTNLPNLKLTLDVYCCRWGIEQMFKDYKTAGASHFCSQARNWS